jgi:LPS-assembly protein
MKSIRLLTVTVLLGMSKASAEIEGGWDCHRSDDDKEWLCATRTPKPPPKLEAPAKAAIKQAPPATTAARPPKRSTSPSETFVTPTLEAAPIPEATAARAESPARETATKSEQAEPQETTPETSKPPTLATEEETGPAGTVALIANERYQGKPIPEAVTQEAAVTPTEGWACAPEEEGADWDCTLSGPDPQGLPRPVREEGAEPLLSPAFSYTQEQLFQNMVTKSAIDPWAICSPQLGPPAKVAAKGSQDDVPIEIDANYTDIFQKEIVTLKGNVDVTRGDQKIYAEDATYDTVSTSLSARSNVYYSDQNLSLYSNSAHLKLDANEGRLRDSLFILDNVPARGSSSQVDIDSRTRMRLQDVAYTTCAPGNQDWTMEAANLELDRESGVGVARNAWLEVKGLPVFYTPYIEFPIDDRRKSGILVPTFGSTDQAGFDFTLPYYWNIAPNYDATFAPRYTTRRGFLLGGNFRYLTKMTQGEIAAELMPLDQVSKKTRGAVSAINRTHFTPNLNTDFDLNYISDNDYLNELGNSLAITNFKHIRSRANLRYNPDWMSLQVRVENYQTIDPSIRSTNRPYRMLPRIRMDMNEQLGNLDGRFRMRSEYVFFQRDNTVTSNRIDLRPELSWPIRTPGAFVKPSATLRFTQYWLNDQDVDTPDTITRALPLISLDSGLIFERDTTLGGNPYIHTLEPRLYYLYVPYTDQNDIPLFDTSQNDFTALQLYRNNRFSGSDRIGDANQVTAGLTSRILESATGRERLKVSIGSIVYFRNRSVTLRPSDLTETSTISNLIGELNAEITDHWSFRSGVQWDPPNSEIDRAQVALRYRDVPEKIFNLAYRFRQNQNKQLINETIINQIDTSFRWPVITDLHLVGRWQYSFRDDTTLESFVGIEKDSCCWRFRILGRRWITNINNRIIGTAVPNVGVFMQLELKGLASFGDSVDNFLERHISGYEVPDY